MIPAKDRLIFPLDVSDAQVAYDLANRLHSHVGAFKIGLELFISEGPDMVRRLQDKGAKIFLDLKLHDIPATVRRAMERIADLDVFMATVHAQGSMRMMEAAVDASGGKVKVLGVTVLTSLTGNDLIKEGIQPLLADDIARLVSFRARLARDAGCAGVVCSGHEIEAVKERLGRDFITVVPGIRPSFTGGGQDDQRRVVTPATAIRAGADYLVVGRPIRDAEDPANAAQQVVDEIASALG